MTMSACYFFFVESKSEDVWQAAVLGEEGEAVLKHPGYHCRVRLANDAALVTDPELMLPGKVCLLLGFLC